MDVGRGQQWLLPTLYTHTCSNLERNLEYKCAGNYLLDLFNINKGTTATSNETFSLYLRKKLHLRYGSKYSTMELVIFVEDSL